MENLFEFSSIDEFLVDFRRTKNKKSNRSLTQLAKILKYSSDRTIGMVYSRKRVMSQSMKDKIAEYLKLTGKQKEYLDLLVKKDKALRSNASTLEIDKKLKRLRGKKWNYKPLRSEEVAEVGNWFFFPIKNLIYEKKTGLYLKEICSALEGDVSMQDAKRVLLVLQRWNLITELKGRYFPIGEESNYLHTPVDIPSSAVRIAHGGMLDRAKVVLNSQSILDREFVSKTFAMPSEKVSYAKKRIREFCEELSDELIDSESKQEKDIYQLSVQFFRQGECIK